MRKFNKIISLLLAVFMIISAISSVMLVQVSADDASSDASKTDSSANNSSNEAKEEDTEEETRVEVDYINDIFATPEDKLATMEKAEISNDTYELYYDKVSGEVACVNKITGEKLFTNPYDVGASTGSDTTKYEVLSQVIVKFTDNKGQNKVFSSYEQAVLRNQIVTKNIKNGIRVEYTIGREQSKTLVPRLISKDRFDGIILKALEEAFGEELYNPRTENVELDKVQEFLAYYTLYSKDALDPTEREKKYNVFGMITDGFGESDRLLATYRNKYSIVDSMAFYVFPTEPSDAVLARCEQIILTYCPEYTYEEMDYDHALTDYESEDENPPVFRMALEYRLDAKGLSVRLPANGIRFNESLYTLEGIEVLPYMGAGNSGYKGYNFFPDGSGTLFDFEDLNTTQTRSVTSNVYSTDYAYHEIKGTYQKAIRYPVFGIVENTTYHTFTDIDVETGNVNSQFTISGAMVEAIRANLAGESGKVYKGKEGTLYSKFGSLLKGTETVETVKRGFVAIIEEGDALASLTTYHAGSLSDYNTIKMSFIPRPKDSYNLQDSISVGANSNWTVVSERKYVGSYKMRYIMLSDSEKVADKAGTYYDASWLGMAIAYRDYLTEKGIISKLTSDEVNKDIPLYIETFGAVETTERYLSIPVTVMAPLTTFEHVLQMYEDLSADVKDENGNVTAHGIKNINFKLTGYANGGMYYTVPGNLKFERAVGGNKGFQALLDKAAEINSSDAEGSIGIYPDFDFVYQLGDDWFDGYSTREHAAKTIDDRYASRREYSATQQKYMNYYELVISPAYFSTLYERLEKNYSEKYENVMGISVSTLGQWLNSDFDEDEPYNREDSKGFTIDAFEYFKGEYGDVMTEGGNSYVWKYADHILNMSLDSSRYNFSSNAVPFIGVVLHGSVSFTGEPLNMEGDMQYALLKAIENGASPYFILSMTNTQALKEYFDLSQYYSIRYDIWKDDIAGVYSILNDVLCDVQDKYIVGHEFLEGERIPDGDELDQDIYNEYIADLEAERNAAQILANELAFKASQARKDGRLAEEYAAEALLKALTLYTNNLVNQKSAVVFGEGYFERSKAAYINYYKAELSGDKDAIAKYQTILYSVNDYNVDSEVFEKIYDEMTASVKSLANALTANHAEFINSYLPVVIESYIIENEIEGTGTLASDLAATIAKDFKGSTLSELEKFVSDYISKLEGVTLPEKFASSVSKVIFPYFKTDIGITTIASAYTQLNDSIKILSNGIKKHSDSLVAYNKALSAYYYIAEDAENAAEIKALYDAYVAAKDAYAASVDAEVAEAYAAAEKAYFEAVEALAEAIEDMNDAKAALENLKSAGAAAAQNVESESATETATETETEIEIATIEDAQAAYDKAYDTIYRLAYENVLANAKNAYDAAKAAYLEAGDADLKAALDAAAAAFDATVAEDVKTAITDGETAFADYLSFSAGIANAYYQLTVTVPAFEEIADNALMAYAAENAMKLVISSGFNIDYETAFEIYNNYEKCNRYFSAFKDNVQSAIAPTSLAGIINGGFDAFVNADKAKSELENESKAFVAAKSKGNVDRYVGAIAEVVALETLGYNAEDASDSMKNTYKNATNVLQSERKRAISSMAMLDASSMKSLVTIMETVSEHLTKAEAAVEVLESGNYSNRVVEQARDRANAVAEYLNGKANYIEITDGRLSEYVYTVGGKEVPLYYVRNEKSEIVYFYGTLETGYTYLTRNEDGSFALCERGLNGLANPSGAEWNGLRVFQEGNTYFVTSPVDTDTVKAGYTYLNYNKYYNSYEEKDPTVYAGTKVNTLDDGTVVYYDKSADVYYSVNADGTYTRYNYYMSISDYYNSAMSNSAATMVDGYAMVAECGEYDANFEADVKARIERENAKNNVEEEVVEEEEISKYTTENIVVVTYGNDDNTPYKSIILNYNNYSVKVVYEGIEYTIDPYQFVVINYKK